MENYVGAEYVPPAVVQKHNKLEYESYNSGCPSPSWFGVRVLYARVSSCAKDEIPECLTIKILSRNIDTALEVNGGRVSPSEERLLHLRRDRLDVDSLEVTYVTTNNLRTSGSLAFEIYDGNTILVSGAFQKSERAGDLQGRRGFDSGRSLWNLDCCCTVGPEGCAFLKGRRDHAIVTLTPPTLEICIVGHYDGSPVIVTKSVDLIARRRLIRQGTLDAIPEDDECVTNWENTLLHRENGQEDLQIYLQSPDKLNLLKGSYGSEECTGYLQDEDGDVSWFNAGVRVGVGIGLGMCLGIGIGVGLLVRTYQATTRTFRKRIL